MESGKPDEELARMTGVIAQIAPRRAAAVQRVVRLGQPTGGLGGRPQIIHVLTEAGIGIFSFVTHLYDLAESRSGQDTAGMHQTATA